jgi:hypothetical protein
MQTSTPTRVQTPTEPSNLQHISFLLLTLPSTPTPTFPLLLLPNLIRNPPKQRLTLPLLPTRLRVRHLLPLALLNSPNPPTPSLPRLLKELQVLIKRPPSSLRHVHIRPGSGEQVCGAEDGEELVAEVVEEDGRQEGDGEVGQAPDYHADGGALGAGGCGVDFGGD